MAVSTAALNPILLGSDFDACAASPNQQADIGDSGADLLILEPLRVPDLHRSQRYRRALYTLKSRFSPGDTLLFTRKVDRLSVRRVDAPNPSELICWFEIDSGFVQFGRHTLAVLDSQLNLKADVSLEVRYAKAPVIERIKIEQGERTHPDTLSLLQSGVTVAAMTLTGEGLFRSSTVVFDDERIRVLDDPGWRVDDPPDGLRIGIEIPERDVRVGRTQFRIRNPYAMEGVASLILVGARPQLLGAPPDFIADGEEKSFTLNGVNLHSGLEMDLLPPEGTVRALALSGTEVKVLLNFPVLEKDRSYRLVLRNPDGGADTSRYFIARSMPLAEAKIEGQAIFTGVRTGVVVKVESGRGRRLQRGRFYEINVEGDRFPVARVIDDSTCEAIINVRERPGTLTDQRTFSVNEVGQSARWKGTFRSRPSPVVDFMSGIRTLHPADTLKLVLRGRNLAGISLSVRDPEVLFFIDENRGDLVRARAVAGRNTTPGLYPLGMRLEGVDFNFPDLTLTVKPWMPFHEYVSLEITGSGLLKADSLWRGYGAVHPMEVDDELIVRAYASRVPPQMGAQKLDISGVLMDSSNTIRAEAFGSRRLIVEPGSDILTWQWRVRERIRSGDRIEITLKNPGGQNKVTEQFFVMPHWSEAFHGSTSFILFKVPFNGGDATTEILRSIGIGLTYQPDKERRFLAFDASFIIGNVATGEDNLSVEVGLGLSAILWHHLQVGLGTNLSGNTFSQAFLFVGTRFKLPVPWKF